MSKRLVVIPALNEQETVADVVREAREAFPDVPVVVINDGSVDRTEACAREAGALVVNLPLRTGIGGAIQVGYLYAVRNGFDVMIRMDGDGQHIAKEALPLVELVESGAADLAIGSRFIGAQVIKSTTPLRRLGIRMFSLVVRALFTLNISDPTSGFWVLGNRALEALSAHCPEDFPEVESLAICKRIGLKVQELPVLMRLRQGGRSSIGPVDAMIYLIKVTFALLVISIRRYRKE